jgi:hypothetical protein
VCLVWELIGGLRVKLLKETGFHIGGLRVKLLKETGFHIGGLRVKLLHTLRELELREVYLGLET